MIVNGIAWNRSAERSVSACISSGAVMPVGSPPGAPGPRGRGARSVRSRRSRRGRAPRGPALPAIRFRSGVWVSHACWASRWTTRYASSRARPCGHERQQHALGEQRAAGELEVGAHAVGVDGHAAHDAQREVLHVVEQDRRVGQHHALGAGVRDVALVPQRDVLQARLGVAAQHAGEAGDALGVDRVALVRHRARALLAGAERLLDLAHLGALEVADLRGEALDPGAGERDRLEQLGVAVARDDLRGDRLGGEAQALEHARLVVRAERRVGADRAGDRARRGLLERALAAARRCGAPRTRSRPA